MRLSEIYTSCQGEGPGVGHMTQFIRFAGCNLRCPGWPCDTQHAIDPELYRHEWKTVTPEDVIVLVQPYPRRVTLTGGEPFLQPAGELAHLLAHLIHSGYSIEIFTNGTRPWSVWISYHPSISIIMDWKLQGSGEDPSNEVRIANLATLQSSGAVKFVIKDENDFKQALYLWEQHIWKPRLPVQVYYGAVWGTVKDATLVEWIQREQLDWKLNVQMHNYIFGAHTRGT